MSTVQRGRGWRGEIVSLIKLVTRKDVQKNPHSRKETGEEKEGRKEQEATPTRPPLILAIACTSARLVLLFDLSLESDDARALEDDTLGRPALPRLLVADQQSCPGRDLEDLLDTLTRSTGAFHVVLGSDLGGDGLSLSAR